MCKHKENSHYLQSGGREEGGFYQMGHLPLTVVNCHCYARGLKTIFSVGVGQKGKYNLSKFHRLQSLLYLLEN